MTFPSKIDTWLLGVIAAVLLGNLILIIVLWLNLPNNTTVAAISTTALLLAVLAAIAWLFLSTQYTVRSNHLIVRSGPFSWRIPIDTIAKVKATRNPLSAPALSLDRLEISYGDRRTILVSPKDTAGFLQAIRQTLSE
jgi:membrane protein YdbS with pleckstrin-like domain